MSVSPRVRKSERMSECEGERNRVREGRKFYYIAKWRA